MVKAGSEPCARLICGSLRGRHQIVELDLEGAGEGRQYPHRAVALGGLDAGKIGLAQVHAAGQSVLAQPPVFAPHRTRFSPSMMR